MSRGAADQFHSREGYAQQQGGYHGAPGMMGQQQQPPGFVGGYPGAPNPNQSYDQHQLPPREQKGKGLGGLLSKLSARASGLVRRVMGGIRNNMGMVVVDTHNSMVMGAIRSNMVMVMADTVRRTRSLGWEPVGRWRWVREGDCWVEQCWRIVWAEIMGVMVVMTEGDMVGMTEEDMVGMTEEGMVGMTAGVILEVAEILGAVMVVVEGIEGFGYLNRAGL